ncbi:MAG: DoxX family protein [Gemmatimonadota bacterium]|nr:DoxX family protein [Gemmatimonadota bacterium]
MVDVASRTEAAGTLGKLKVVGLWLLTVVMALLLGAAGAAKFVQPDMWTGLFAGWGYPAWFSYVTGALEMGGAVVLLVPRFATYAAALLMVVMIGAAATVTLNPGEMVATPALVNLVGLAIVAWARRDRRWRPS